MAKEDTSKKTGDTNPDPVTGEPGSHPVGTGVGAAAGGAAGAAIGSAGGPVGTAVGAVIGAVAGGYAGRAVAEAFDPTVEDAYWREHHGTQPYAKSNPRYEDFEPAYRTGFTGYREGRSFEEREADLRAQYESAETAQVGADQGKKDPTTTILNNPTGRQLRWEEAREAVRAAYERVGRGEARRDIPRKQPMVD